MMQNKDKMQIFIETDTDRVNLYLSSPKGQKGSYAKYCLRHFTDDFRDGGTYQNQDIWRFYELYVGKIQENTFQADFPYAILNGGEWECALRIGGTPDFHGGLHGYEHQKMVVAMADGQELTLGTQGSRWAEQVEFCQQSEIYRQGTRDEIIALHSKHYQFKDGKVMLHQELLWQQAVTVLYSYMAMLPIKRTSDNTPEGEVISDRVTIDGGKTVYDVGKEGHQTGISSVADHVRNVQHAKIWGEQSGICAELTINCDFKPCNNFFVQNTKEYNKFYFSFAGDGAGYQTTCGEKWILDTEYEIYRRQ